MQNNTDKQFSVGMMLIVTVTTSFLSLSCDTTASMHEARAMRVNIENQQSNEALEARPAMKTIPPLVDGLFYIVKVDVDGNAVDGIDEQGNRVSYGSRPPKQNIQSYMKDPWGTYGPSRFGDAYKVVKYSTSAKEFELIVESLDGKDAFRATRERRYVRQDGEWINVGEYEYR